MSESLSVIANRAIPLNLTFKFSKTEIGILQLDLLLSEEINYDGQVTRYPVEDGSEISDNITQGSLTLKISGVCSASEAYSLNLNTGKTKFLGFLETMEFLKKERKLIDVTTALCIYKDFGIETLRAVRSNNRERDGNWIEINAELRHVKKVKLKTADVPAAAPAEGRTGQTNAKTNANANSSNAASSAAASTPATETTPPSLAMQIGRYMGMLK